jgi:hypothetical protein
VPEKVIGPDDLTITDLGLMCTRDFVYLKNELIKRNNAGELNIDLLTIVGFEFGGLVAWNWTATDWTQPDATIRLGRDVKALALVSPVYLHKKPRIDASKAMQLVGAIRGMSIMVISGTNDKDAAKEVTRVDTAVSKYHPEPKPKMNESQEDFDKRYLLEKTYYKREKATILQGVKMLGVPELKVANDILGFVKLRVVNRAAAKDLPPWDGERNMDPIPGP